MLGGVAALAAVVVAVGVALGGGGGASNSAKAPAPVQSAGIFKGIPQKGIALGSPKARVTLEEFADLQCPYCRDYALDGLPKIVQRYVRTGKVRLEFRTIAILGDQSVRAAQMANAAQQQNHLWEFIDRLYAQQGEENTGYVTPEFLRGIASEVSGLDVNRALSFSQTQRSLEPLASAHERANALGIASTPSFMIGRTGGKLHRLEVSSLGIDGFAGPIERELAAAG